MRKLKSYLGSYDVVHQSARVDNFMKALVSLDYFFIYNFVFFHIIG